MYLPTIIGLATLCAVPAFASFDGNLNYDSPSRRHPNLGISIPIVSRRSYKRDAIAYRPSELNFTHGIASGDPFPDSVIIWTRIAPSLVSSNSNVTVQGPVPLYNHDTETYIKADANPICVNWKLMPAAGNSTTAVSTGTAYTTGDIDYTVKVRSNLRIMAIPTPSCTDACQVEATGLTPFTAYRYQFTVCGSNKTSPIGLTKTAPAYDADIDQVKLAVFSCSNYRRFPRLLEIAKHVLTVIVSCWLLQRLRKCGKESSARLRGEPQKRTPDVQSDLIGNQVHLGDYIYESAARGPRAHNPPRLLFSLYDYRTRHGQVRCYRPDNAQDED